MNTLSTLLPFDVVLKTLISISANIYQTAGENICSALKKQRDYNRYQKASNKIQVGQKVLLKNQRRMNSDKRFSLFTVHSIFTVRSFLTNKGGAQIKTKIDISLFKS